MAVQVRERDIDEIKEKLATMKTPLNQISYLESALKDSGFTFEIKRFLYDTISELYAERKMYDRAARAMSNKATIEVVFRDKIESYLSAAELYAKAGRVEEADHMFIAATRDASETQKSSIRLARKNIYMSLAKELESKGKRATAGKFYEKLIKMTLSPQEKDDVKEKLKKTYIALGQFREARLLEGI